ncbi:MAG: caspase family protein [Verrucomicrobiaceae bacterium]|nr:caspase family protein [Verrucomicrobiaceae bacterium]
MSSSSPNKSSAHTLQADIVAYMDDMLPARDRVVVEQHLRSCPGCRQRIKRTQQLLAAATLREPSAAESERYLSLVAPKHSALPSHTAEPAPAAQPTLTVLPAQPDKARHVRPHFTLARIAAAAALVMMAIGALKLRHPEEDPFSNSRGVGQALPAVKQVPGRRAALIVAVTEGAQGRAVKGGEVDAGTLPEVLMLRCGFPRDRVLVLRGADATEAGVVSALRCLRSQYSAPSDVIYVHFASHGRVEGNGLRLLMADSPETGGITAAQLQALFKDWPGQVLFVADACQGGSVEKIAWGIAQRPWMIASAQADENAYDGPQLGSLFTHHWKDALMGDADGNRDGFVTLGEAFAFTRTALAKRDKQQTPALLPDRETQTLLLAGVTTASTDYPPQPGVLDLRFPASGAHVLRLDGQDIGVLRGSTWRGWVGPGEHQLELRLLPEGATVPVLWRRAVTLPPGPSPVAVEVNPAAATLPILEAEGPFTSVTYLPDASQAHVITEPDGVDVVLTVPVAAAAPAAAVHGVRFEASDPVRLSALFGGRVVLRLRIVAERSLAGVEVSCGLPQSISGIGARTTVNLKAGEERLVDLPLSAELAASPLTIGLAVQLPAQAAPNVYRFRLVDAHFAVSEEKSK